MRSPVLLAAALASVAHAQPPAASPPAPPTARGEAMIDAYFRAQVKQLSDGCLADLTTQADWEKRRPELRRQFLEMVGLWPLPPRTDLKPVVTGTADGEGFTVEKLHFQSAPGLYVTANLYRPKAPPAGRLPAILYVCGHGNVVENGVSYGSKVKYQYHPAWFAAHGYVCLALDTLQLSEIPGFHHGTHNLGWWWWQTRGYTPAGVECWNAMRALDYLETRPDVDAKKIGVTGRSGGGATTWWVAAADERPAAFAPVAGIGDLYSYVVEAELPPFVKGGTVPGHCDCMFAVNTYRWDWPQIAALAAPRPLLLGNSDADTIFPVGGYRRLADKVRKVYGLYGTDADARFQLLETKGPHVDTPELRIGINKWMNRWLKGDTTTEVKDDLPPPLTPQQLKVLDRNPEGALNDTIHEYFVKPAALPLPASDAVAKEWWANRRPELVRGLADKVFAGWPTTPPPLAAKVAADVTADGVRLRAVDFASEAGIDLRLWVVTAEGVEKPTKVILSVLDEPAWAAWCKDLGPAFAKPLGLDKPPARDDAKFEQNRAALRANKWAFAAVAPRGVGPTRWADAGSKADTHHRRRFALIGQTLDGMRVWDARRAVAAIPEVAGLKDAPVTLHGDGAAAGIALYAGLFEPSVAAFDLWHLPPSHRVGPTLLNVAKVLDVPQAVALLAPRPVAVHTAAADKAAWDWPLRVRKVCGEPGLTVEVTDAP